MVQPDANVTMMKVVVFGTGNFGKIVVRCVLEAGISISRICDVNPLNHGKYFCGFSVVGPDDLGPDDHIFLATNISNRKFLRKLCMDQGVSSIENVDAILRKSSWKQFYSELDLEWSMDRAQEVVDLYLYDIDSESDISSLRVKSLDVVLTERCSLKCVDCSNLMQYYQQPVGAEVELLTQSLNNFFDSVDYVSELRLIGGEPLVSRNIAKVLDVIYSHKNFDKIVVYTNGTIVPKDELLERFQDPRVWVKISDYGSISKKASLLAEKCESLGINCMHEQVTEWEDVGRIIDRKRTLDDNKIVFGNCCVNDTLTLLHGYLYACPFSAHADNLGALKNAEADKVEMVNMNSLKDRIRSLYIGKEVLVACGLCNGRDHVVSKVVAGVQTRTPLRIEVNIG